MNKKQTTTYDFGAIVVTEDQSADKLMSRAEVRIPENNSITHVLESAAVRMLTWGNGEGDTHTTVVVIPQNLIGEVIQVLTEAQEKLELRENLVK